MAEVYASLIRKGFKTMDEIPELLREAVKAILDPDEDSDWPVKER